MPAEVWYYYLMPTFAEALSAHLESPRRQGEPKYVRLRSALEDLIGKGYAGSRGELPPERELARASGLSRVTVRKALKGLVARGLVAQRPGAGTFVGERIVRSLSRLTSFTEDLRARRLDPRVVFLDRSAGEVTTSESMALGVPPGTRVVRLKRLRYAGSSPLAVESTVTPQSMLPSPELVEASLYEALTRLGHPPHHALQRLRAIGLDADTAARLELPVGSPALHIERRTFLADGRSCEYTLSTYRADAYDFVAELTTS
jgi:GntR family transcriptional regulator